VVPDSRRRFARNGKRSRRWALGGAVVEEIGTLPLG
jgi:hypothetical protein